ncbi:MAG: GNAT family N-acetyltransferase [Pseudomonadota bacterium]
MSALRRAGSADAPLLAALHAGAFEAPWSEDAFETLLAAFGVFGLIAGGVGFILCRTVADEAEILTLAVLPAHRRKGAAAALVEAAAALAAARGAQSLFLEVAADNAPALALYASRGFAEAGLRNGYYASGADALVMRRMLNS